MEPKCSLPCSQQPTNCPILSQSNGRTTLQVQSHLHLRLPSGLFPSDFLTNTLHEPPHPTTHTIFPAYLILPDLITRIIFGKEYRSLSSSLRSLLHSPVPSALLDLNSFLSTLFSNILSLGSHLNVGTFS